MALVCKHCGEEELPHDLYPPHWFFYWFPPEYFCAPFKTQLSFDFTIIAISGETGYFWAPPMCSHGSLRVHLIVYYIYTTIYYFSLSALPSYILQSIKNKFSVSLQRLNVLFTEHKEPNLICIYFKFLK